MLSAIGLGFAQYWEMGIPCEVFHGYFEVGKAIKVGSLIQEQKNSTGILG